MLLISVGRPAARDSAPKSRSAFFNSTACFRRQPGGQSRQPVEVPPCRADHATTMTTTISDRENLETAPGATGGMVWICAGFSDVTATANGFLLFLGGMVVFIVGRVGAWWFHE
jgi:hypothetical protein